MNSDTEAEVERVRNRQLKYIIKEEEKLSELMFNQLSEEPDINLIFLYSQLMAERGRSDYFRNLIESKSHGGKLKLEPKGHQNNSSGDEREDSVKLIYNSLRERRSSSESDSSSEFFSRYSEKSRGLEEKYKNEVNNIQNTLNISQKNNKQLRKKVKDINETIERLEETNEMLEEVTRSLEKVIAEKEAIIVTLRNELNQKQDLIDSLTTRKYQAHEENVEEKNLMISQLQHTIQEQIVKLQALEAIIEKNQTVTNQKTITIGKLQLEKKSLFEQLYAMNAEVNAHKEASILYKEKIVKIKEEFEIEKKSIILKLKAEKDNLSMKLKDAYLMVELQNISTMDSSINELSELDEVNHETITEQSLKLDSQCLAKDSELMIQIKNLIEANEMIKKQLKESLEKNNKKIIGISCEVQADLDKEFPTKIVELKPNKSSKSFLFWNKPNHIVTKLFL